MTALVLLGGLLVFLLLGVPVAMSLGLSSAIVMVLMTDQSMMSLALKFAHTMKVYPLLAIPFFILAGTLMSTGGVAKRMINFAIASVGHFRGGLAMASVLACTLFAAVSGSSPATVLAIGPIVIGAMIKSGYSKEFAAGVICNAGTLGILIPPSIVMVVYASVTQTSVGELFMAGVVPGILLTMMMMLAIYIVTRKMDIDYFPKASFREVLRTGKEALWGLMLIIIIMGGIYAGIFTPTEAAAVSAVYAFVVVVFIYKDLKLKEIPKVLTESAKLSVTLMFIIANAYVFAFVLTTEQIPQTAADVVLSSGLSPWLFLLVMNLLLLVAGNFIDPTSVILIVVPIIFPIAMSLGIDPIHLGIILVINMEIGLVTPPVGLNLFVTSGVTDLTLVEMIHAALPWLLLLLTALMLITYVPIISTFLPNMVFD
ncbi:MAG: TRAP transporter large permease subunit [Arenicellaceae bacterium]|nr:TRAP transporter large permease subunit [Arenicellaceae bacterium]